MPKYLQARPGWHERARLLKEAGEQELSVRQPDAATAALLVRFEVIEQERDFLKKRGVFAKGIRR